MGRMNNWRKSSHSFSNGNCAEVAAWRKSTASYANGSCVEAAGNWRKSSRSMSNGQCAEVGQDGAVVGVRDSRDPGGPVLTFGAGAWKAFTARLRSA
jgi:hypothetical protein